MSEAGLETQHDQCEPTAHGNVLGLRQRQRASAHALKAAAVVLVVLPICAVLYYRLHEHYSLLDAVFLTVTIIATIDTGKLTAAGKVFTVFFILAGLTAVTLAARYGAELVVGEQLLGYWGRRKRMKAIGKLKDHHIVCGYGRMGQEIVRQLRRHRAELVVVERDPEQLARLEEEGVLFVAGNATDDQALVAAAIERARSLVAVTSSDEDNLFLVLSARALNPDLYIVARCVSPGAHDKLTRAGADRVVSPYITGGRQMAGALLSPVLVDFLDLWLRAEEMDLDLAEIHVSAQAPFVGSTLASAAIREQCGAGIIAVRGPDGRFHTNPSPESMLQAGDVLIALGSPEQLSCLDHIARGKG